MKIIVNNNRKIKDVQAQFQWYYPYLLLEFYTPDADGDKLPLSGENKFGEVRLFAGKEPIVIDDETTIADLEFKFAHTFGIEVEVFKNVAGEWLSTSSTDHWTIKFQSHKAELSHCEEEEEEGLTVNENFQMFI